MPINTITSRADLDYVPTKALQGVSFYIPSDWTNDSTGPCKIGGDLDGQVVK